MALKFPAEVVSDYIFWMPIKRGMIKEEKENYNSHKIECQETIKMSKNLK